MRNFKKIRSVDLPYNKQGEIYFTCLNYKGQSKQVRDKIDRLCQEIGGAYAPALFMLLTTEMRCMEIAQRYYIDESILYRMRRTFYMNW